MGKITELLKDKYKLRIPPTVYYDLLADVQEVEEDQEPFKPMVEIDLYSVIKQKYIEREVLDKIRAEIEQNAYPIVHGVNNHEKGMTLYGILQVIDKYKAETENT